MAISPIRVGCPSSISSIWPGAPKDVNASLFVVLLVGGTRRKLGPRCNRSRGISWSIWKEKNNCENVQLTASMWSGLHDTFCNKQRYLINLDWKTFFVKPLV